MYSPELLELDQLFKVKEIDGYPSQLGHLISMLNYARITTFDAVKDLSISDLDFLIDEKANSIGMLLLHIASVEFDIQKETIENRALLEAEMECWEPALQLGELGRNNIRGHSIDFYIDQLAQVRKKTLEDFQKLDDSWLYIETDFWDNKKANNYFKWFHVLEDEINHRGQIRMIRKRIK
ncbi:MAG: DinB family protein [Chitinophagales bacterium]|jgi:uncharacterized damage-inducible protein DinB|nr:DUF664 domain-containing protein [Sphingobacteriales bacterium]